MIRINIAERNDLALCIQSMRYKEEMEEEMERKRDEKSAVNSNETAKREMASELMMQGFSGEAICRILNISPDRLPEQMPF